MSNKMRAVPISIKEANAFMDVARTKCSAYHSGGLIRYRVLFGKEGL